jgi:hypothetical protein
MKKVTVLLIIAIIVAIGNLSSAQTSFERIYGGSADDAGYALIQAPDGNFIIVGATGSFGGGVDMYALKLNQQGDIIWQHNYGGAADDYAYSICEAPDGGHLIVGATASFGHGRYDVYLQKIDSLGNPTDAAYYGGDSSDYGYSVRPTSDNGYVVAGNTNSFGVVGDDGYVIKVNQQLDSVWARTYAYPATPYNDRLSSIAETSDSGYIAVGQYFSWPTKAWVIRLNRYGNPNWQNIYANEYWGRGSDIIEKTPGQYYATGVWGVLFQSSYMTLVNINSEGTMANHWSYGIDAMQTGESIIATADGGFAMAGSVMRNGNFDIILVKTDSLGNQQWCRYFGGDDVDMGCDLIQANDGGYLVVGYTRSFGAANTDVYVIKTDSLGQTTGIEDEKATLPRNPEMAQNYPNPFNGRTIIQFNLETPGTATVNIYDLLGREIRTLYDDYATAGTHRILFDGSGLAGGIYFYRIKSGAFSQTNQMVLLK